MKDEFDRPLGATLKDIFLEGVQFPPTLIASAALGVWFMLTPLTLGVEGALYDANHLLGALIVTTSVIAFSETGRAARWLNIAMAALLIALSLFWSQSWLVLGVNVLACLALIALTPPTGPVKSRYGSWDKYVV